MSQSESTPDSPAVPGTEPHLEHFREQLTEDAFNDWHLIQERNRNADEGYDDTRNDPAHMPAPEDQSPSNLLNCHRMSYYKARNTPREEKLPYGIFKFGHDFEAYAETFLQEQVSPEGTTVKNVERIDFENEDIRFTGSTDPVIFDDQTDKPLALFEVKTSKNLHFVRKGGVKTRHKAQSHAYARGLQEKYNLESPPPIFFIYGGREDLDVAMFEVEFDAEFWNDEVIEWAEQDTEYRNDVELPPALDPDGSKSYMCSYCDYAERCGNYEPSSESPNSSNYVESVDDYWWDDSIDTDFQNTVSDMPPEGFLPLAVIGHLASYPGVHLTPTLAVQYPELVDDGSEPSERLMNVFGAAPQRPVEDFVCPKCLTSFPFEDFEWDGDFDDLPTCPDCPDDPPLRGPKPGELML